LLDHALAERINIIENHRPHEWCGDTQPGGDDARDTHGRRPVSGYLPVYFVLRII
jgi:hypothetical protein